MNGQTPPNFPANIPIQKSTFQNWAKTIVVSDLWTCTPATPQDVMTVCNWAKDNGYKIRPRGIMHTWSPLTVVEGTPPSAKIVLVDTQKLNQITVQGPTASQGPRVKVQTGARMDSLLLALEYSRVGSYSFPHVPAPGNLTVGGVLAIDAHGSAIPSPADSFDVSYGSLSNQILEFTAVVTDPQSPQPTQYSLRTFTRGEGDDKAFLTHLGRAFLIDATLQVIPNYNLRCQSFMNIGIDTLCAPPRSEGPPPQSIADFLAQCGRMEVIWFPFTSNPWFKLWTTSSTLPPGSTEVYGPYNYGFSDNLPTWLLNLLQEVATSHPEWAPQFGQGMATITDLGLRTSGADIWGPSKNTLLYVRDSTLLYTANGYAVHVKQTDVQRAVYEFKTYYSKLLSQYQNDNKYPVNGPIEIRVTGLDDPSKMAVNAGMKAQTPVISATAFDQLDTQQQWDVAIWFDLLTLPGTQYADDFYTDLETWIFSNYSAYGRVVPEWSKGWAYSPKTAGSNGGPFTNAAVIEKIRQNFMQGRDSTNNWDYEVATLAKFDKSELFSNDLLATLFVPAGG